MKNADREPVGWSPPTTFDEYRLDRLLGQGAMGQVYLAHDTLLDRAVAVKFIGRAEPSAHQRERFFVEARAVARLQHPNVVAVFRVGEVRMRPYLVSELVRGRSLDKLARPLPPEEVLRIGIGLSRGLAAAHRRGVLHRDIKPANAMVSDEGDIKLLDFGLAKLFDEAGAIAEDGDGERAPAPPSSVEDPSSTRSLEPRAPLLPVAGALTATAQAVGTPLYMSPEAWCGEAPTRAGDVYSLGAVLYELLAGKAPHAEAPLAELGQAVVERDPVALAELAPHADPRLVAVVTRALSRDPARRPPSGDALREELEAVADRPADAPVPAGNPYRGLAVFEAEHRGLFFGRAADVRAVLDRLRAARFVVVTGDSGVGKSSLCRAGVLPLAAEAGALVCTLVPGRHPVAALAAALAPVLPGGTVELAARLRSSPGDVARALHGRPGEALLFVDQIEELVTAADPVEAAAFAEILGTLLERGAPLRFLATARTDFLTRLATLPTLGEELGAALYLLRPLGPSALREVVVGPARAAGFSFETESLVDDLVAGAARAEGGLPLLQFALAELWEARDTKRRLIPASSLAAIGGVAGALARHADAVVAGLLPAERAAVRPLLGRLVTAEGTRLRRTEAELARGDATARRALESLVRGRLLVARAGDDVDAGTYEIAHEALLTGWDTLKAWLLRDREARAVRQRLERAAAEWERLGRTQEALWRARQLAELAHVGAEALGAVEAAFVAASRRAAVRRRGLLAAAIFGIPLALAVGWGSLQLSARLDLDRRVEVHRVEAEAALATARRGATEAAAGRRHALTLFDAGDREVAESAWTEVRARDAADDEARGRAADAFDAALTLDPGRRDLRARLADVLYDRALDADRRRRFGARDELLRRLAAHDEGGDRRRDLRTPARLSLKTSPPSRVRLARYVEDAEGQLALDEARELGTTPLELAVEPGSVLLTFEAAGRAPVRLPLLAARDERLALTVELPPAEHVPAGFVHVPAGRFLFGSDEDEEVRRNFLSAPPLHTVETGAYLIARNEVRFADWIEFLRDLPDEERARRLPHAQVARSVALERLADGRFRLQLRPSAHAYTAVEGEPLRYLGRDRRAVQDWRRFPVAAVSYDDALAYAGWMDRSGRVKGARLCTEREWERAARGADGRRYPGGDRLRPDDADFDVTYGRDPRAYGPDEVGAHPASRSPFGVDDLAGNVWEWVVSSVRPGEPVYRGGSFYQGDITARSNNREVGEAHLRDGVIGLRLCATPR